MKLQYAAKAGLKRWHLYTSPPVYTADVSSPTAFNPESCNGLKRKCLQLQGRSMFHSIQNP